MDLFCFVFSPRLVVLFSDVTSRDTRNDPMKCKHAWGGRVMIMSSKSAEWLQEELENGATALLLLDCRAHELYESSHIESAINLAIPGLMLRRLKKGNLPIRSIIPNNEDKEKFVKRCKTDMVVLYDEAASERQESGLGSSVLGLLLHKLRDDGCKAFYLEGEFRTRAQLERCDGCVRLHTALPKVIKKYVKLS